MKINENGKIRELSPGEQEQLQELQTERYVQPDRLTALEEKLSAMEKAYREGVNHA